MSDKLPARRFSSRRRARLALGGIAAAGLGLGLSGCEDPPAEPMRFSSVEQCVSAGLEQPFCETTYAAALTEHQQAAPQYGSIAECEAEWGEDGCGTGHNATGGQSMFTPLLAGFLVGQALNRRNDVRYYGAGYYGSPIYRQRGGQPVTLTGGGSGRALKMTPVNIGTTTVARSGFGGMGMSRGGSGFGG
jgi:uncharacterized protein YgiB involved in biofilm formation